MAPETVSYINTRIEFHKKMHGIENDTFLRKCLVCYDTWRSGLRCPTNNCTQHAWNIDYMDYLKETNFKQVAKEVMKRHHKLFKKLAEND